MWIFILFSLFIAYIIHFFFKYSSRTISSTHLNGPTPFFPVIGNLFQFELNQLCVAHLNWAKKYGPIFQCVLVKPQVVMADPENLKELFVNDIETYQKTNLSRRVFDDIAGGLILAQNGEEWQRARRLFQPAFQPSMLQHAFLLSLQKSKTLVHRIEDFAMKGEIFDIQSFFLRFTFDIIGLFGFGVDFQAMESEENKFLDAFDYCLNHSIHRLLFPFATWRYLPFLPSEIKYKKQIRILQDEVRKQISYFRETRENKNTILATALNVENQPEWLSDDEIVKQMMTFLFAGHDTTANALTWLFYFVSKDEKVKKKLIQEIDSNIHSLNDISENTLAKMPYLNAVIKETLRLRPSAPVLPSREATRDKEIHWIGNQGQKCTHLISKGNIVTVSPYAVQQLDQFWKNGEIFNPERWISMDESSLHPCSYIPFGAGIRRCIGEKLALLEIRTVTVQVLRHFELELVPDQKVQIYIRVTMCAKDGVKMIARKRENVK